MGRWPLHRSRLMLPQPLLLRDHYPRQEIAHSVSGRRPTLAHVAAGWPGRLAVRLAATRADVGQRRATCAKRCGLNAIPRRLARQDCRLFAIRQLIHVFIPVPRHFASEPPTSPGGIRGRLRRPVSPRRGEVCAVSSKVSTPIRHKSCSGKHLMPNALWKLKRLVKRDLMKRRTFF